MTELNCLVYDEDRFTKELVSDFIRKAEGLSLISEQNIDKADVLFVDAAIYNGDYTVGLHKDAKIIIVSSDHKYIRSLFQNEITDYLVKSELSQNRFEKAIDRVRVNTFQ